MSNIISFFLDWKVKLAILAVVISGAYFWHLSEIKIAVNQVETSIREQVTKENFKLKERSLNTQIELQTKVDKIQKDKDNEIINLKSRVRTLSNSLSNRPSREESSRVPNDSGNEESSRFVAADRLYRDDANVVVWLATRAEGLKIELQACYKQYDEAKETLDKFKRDNQSKIE